MGANGGVAGGFGGDIDGFGGLVRGFGGAAFGGGHWTDLGSGGGLDVGGWIVRW